ncbi:DUF2268 domain-containing putative Zn-dependent protease [Heyndrickxia coagulans]|jgi:uncharacterized protein YjaZ|uniref:DUF2268 domain-containing protein n=1 Tax=Heyndrickxia coagulans TaxID=1398 RepID=A0A133KAI5_HEYCO|nr:DUF2268 domain-containing putative Zn-dependent protease [Heyndrickxia coagulans]APB35652.1 hypothetical protein BIZ35_01800 [Heyndrickxia coagulans]KWZ76586.1 hypothetical protein HMPREF3213_03730 [Heyndrickxia coagulans]KYC63183.1 hypothetical protein B4100_0343 [Heyndrickxia coagulans]QPG54455.1 hypothetical protein IR208_04970 [Heyndrickxia coagulans]WNE62529.1 hypothetical protein KIY57_05330 [Heyndrickxia coagulans]
MLLNIKNLNMFLLNKRYNGIDRDTLNLIKQMGALIPNSEKDKDELMEQNNLFCQYEICNYIFKIKEKCEKIMNCEEEQNLLIVTLNPNYDFALNTLHGVLGYNLINTTYILIYISDYTGIYDTVGSIYVHEYNHVLRNFLLMKDKVQVQKVLFDYIIEEGLAENFVSRVLGEDFLNPWAKHLSLKKVKDNTGIILNYLKEKKTDLIYSILYGDQKRGIPMWLGYSFGFYFIRFIIKESKGQLDFLTGQRKEFFMPYLNEFINWIEKNKGSRIL